MAGPSCSSCMRMRKEEGRTSAPGVLRGGSKWLAGFAVLAALHGAEAFGSVGGRIGGTGVHSPSFLRPTSTSARHWQQHDPRSVWGIQQPVVMRPSAQRPGSVAMKAREAATAPPKIIIAGAPASGKGTQCEMLKERYGVVHLSTGDILRAAVKEGTPLGMQAKAFMDKGELVPDDVIIGVVREKLQSEECVSKGWLLDGFPRTQAQAQALASLGVTPDAFILLNVPDELLVERVVGRRSDPETGKIYHLKYSPPPSDVPLDRLVHRADDTEDKIKVRVAAFHEHCDAVVGCYKDVLVQVDGTQPKLQVFEAIQSAIEGHLSKPQPAGAKVPRIIIAGAPASGKGTQCEMLKEDFGVVHLSTGDILRAAVKEGTPLGMQAKAFMDKGELVPDDVIIGVVREKLQSEECVSKGWLLDGFPRTQAQAQALASLGVTPDAFILLNVPDELLVERVVGRRSDPETGKIYHLKYSPPPSDVPLDRLVHRADDTEDKIKVRVSAFHEHVSSVKGVYESQLVAVDGAAPKDKVYKAILHGLALRGLLPGKPQEARSGMRQALGTMASLAALVGLDVGLRRAFAKAALTFPSSLAGMMGLFGLLLACERGSGARGSLLYRAFKPATTFLTRWLAVFFVPSLVLLPLSFGPGSLLTPPRLLRLVVLTVLGYELSLRGTAALAQALTPPKAPSTPPPPTPTRTTTGRSLTSPKPADASPLQAALSALALLSGAASLAVSRGGGKGVGASVLRALFTASTTLAAYVTGTRLPSKVKAFVHPLLSCAALTLAVLSVYAQLVGQTLTQQLHAYVTRSACPVHLGGGDLLLGLLGPSILAMALQVFDRRKLLFQNAPKVLVTCLGGSVLGLFSSAVLARVLSLPAALGLATLTRCITTPLAMACATTFLQPADVSVAVLMVVITGLLGASRGGGMLKGLGLTEQADPISRGLAMGVSAHGLGTASLNEEPEPLAFSAMSMALTGVLTTVLVACPPVRAVLLTIALGNPA